MKKQKDISVIIPCLNEEKSISFCLEEALQTIKNDNLDAEIVVVDNNSSDNTANVVYSYKNKFPNIVLTREEDVGYGKAYLKGFSVSSGKHIFMADGDGSYDFSQIKIFIDKLKEGEDMVVGNRFVGDSTKTTMSWLHRNIGNPFLSFLVKAFFKIDINDIHCGLRAISRDALSKIHLNTTGMEFASEMIIKGAKAELKISEIAVEYRDRMGDSKLRTFRDGWRHLRFILLYTPLLLFLIPGLLVFIIGFVGLFIFYISNPKLLGVQFYVHPMFLFSIMMIIGYQLVFFSAFAKTYAITHLGDSDKFLEKMFQKLTIEKVGFAGIIIALSGFIIYLFIFIKWISSNAGSLDETKNLIVALTAVVLGIQTFFSSFMFSALSIKEK